MKYQIFELDEDHLKEDRSEYNNRKRVCFKATHFSEDIKNEYSSIEEAIEDIKKFGSDYVNYTVISKIVL